VVLHHALLMVDSQNGAYLEAAVRPAEEES